MDPLHRPEPSHPGIHRPCRQRTPSPSLGCPTARASCPRSESCAWAAQRQSPIPAPTRWPHLDAPHRPDLVDAPNPRTGPSERQNRRLSSSCTDVQSGRTDWQIWDYRAADQGLYLWQIWDRRGANLEFQTRRPRIGGGFTVSETKLIGRHLQRVLAELVHDEPVIVLTGARTVGKSTLLSACANTAGLPVLDLDDLETRRAVSADPALFVASDRPTPIFIDEFQHVPLLLDAIKAELNKDLRPGRYLLTGSTRYGSLPAAGQSLTGRAHVVTMWPLSQGELAGTRETALDALISDPAS